MEFIYARLIQADPRLKKIDDVPLHLKDKVMVLLEMVEQGPTEFDPMTLNVEENKKWFQVWK